jgi:DNA-binding NtrC family response regulator
MRIGALTPRSIDVRFVAATNRDLEAEVALGRFRLDLYYRLNGVSLLIPPLRERVEEIEPLARTFIEQACRRMKRNERPMLSAEALKAMREYSWPGNIRELRNTIERAILLCGRGAILSEHLSTEKMGQTLAQRPRDMQSQPRMPTIPMPMPSVQPEAFDGPEATSRVPRVPLPSPESSGGLHDELNAIEKQRILDALEQCAGNQSRAARLLGISRGKLISRLDAYGIPRPRK